MIQIFCRVERKLRHLILPCVLLKPFHETQMTYEKLFSCQILQRKGNGTIYSAIRMFFFFWQRNEYNPQRVFIQEWPWVRNYNAHNPLYIVFNPKWMIKKVPKKAKVTSFSTLGLEAIYKCFEYFIFKILTSSYISAMFFY